MLFQPELEAMPRRELEALQRQRLHERFGVELEALPELPFRGQVRSARRVPLRPPARSTRGVHPDSRFLRHPRQGDDRRVHPQRHRAVGGLLCACDRRRGRWAGHGRPRRLRVRPLHRRARAPLRRRAARLHRRPRVGREHAAPGAAARGSRRGDPLLHAELRARDRRPRLRGRRGSRCGPVSSVQSRGRRGCARRSSTPSTSQRSTSTVSRRSSDPVSPRSVSRDATART